MGVDDFEVLGKLVVEQATGHPVVGDGTAGGGFDWSTLLSAGSELAQKGVGQYESSQASDKAKADSAARAAKSIAADAAWANAEAMLDVATHAKDAPRISSAQALVQNSMGAAASAAAGLPPDAAAKRVAAAQAASTKAAQDAFAAPSDAAKQAAMRAWQKVAAAASMGSSTAAAMSPDAGGHKGGGGSSFLTKMHGPLPTWGWMVGGTVFLTGGALLVRSLLKRKK